jgi:hypothetical protein
MQEFRVRPVSAEETVYAGKISLFPAFNKLAQVSVRSQVQTFPVRNPKCLQYAPNFGEAAFTETSFGADIFEANQIGATGQQIQCIKEYRK